jgi:hypothetical protein
MRAKVWLYPGIAGWHFITLPKKQSAEIKKHFGIMAHGWGSLPVKVTVLRQDSGQVGITWKTSIFPDKKSNAYLLPLKAAVRKKEHIQLGDTINFIIEILVD